MIKIYLMLAYVGWAWTLVALAALFVALRLKGNRGRAGRRGTDAEETAA